MPRSHNIRGPFYTNAFFLTGALLTLYVLLRAWFVAPLHDENATFYHFIETGAIMGKNTLLDANNHLFNSYLGRWIYQAFGVHFFLFRLPTVLAFAFYFAAIVQLTRTVSISWQRWLLVLGTVCVPFITDYFAYTRGYGLALCFFAWSLVFLQRWMNTLRPVHFWLLITCGWFSAFSNLTLLMSSFLLVGFAVFIAVVRRAQLKRSTIIFSAIGISAFAVASLPLVRFTMQLREANALYYGSLDGLWQVTGKTLCRYVLFYDADWLKWGLALLAVLGLVLLVVLLRRNGFVKQVQQPETVFVYFLAGNVAIILFLAKGMQVNYPEDRAGMYLIPLTVLAGGHLLHRFRLMQYGVVTFLFFPLTFLAQLNLNSSVFTPDQRMKTAFYKQLRKQIRSTETVCVDPIQQLNWARFERTFHPEDPHAATVQRPATADYDVIITNVAFPLPERYRYNIIAYDRETGVIALRRKKTGRHAISKHLPTYSGSDAYIELFNDSIAAFQRSGSYRLLLSGSVHSDTCYRDLQVVIATEDSLGQTVISHSYNLRWYWGENRRTIPLRFAYSRPVFTQQEVRIKAHIWNPEHRKITLK